MALPPILQVQAPTAAVRASQQQKSAAAAYTGPAHPRPVYVPPAPARIAAAAGRAQIPYQHPQAPNPTTRRATGKPTISPAQRLALALAWEQRIPELGQLWARGPQGAQPIQGRELGTPLQMVKSGVWDVSGATHGGISLLGNRFNPVLARPPSLVGATGGFYSPNAPKRYDSLPPHVPTGDRMGRNVTAPLQNFNPKSRSDGELGGLTLANPRRIPTLRGRKGLLV